MWTKRLSIIAIVYIAAITIINCDGGSDSKIKVDIDASGQNGEANEGTDASRSIDANPPDSQIDTSQPNEQLDASSPDGQTDTSQPNEQLDASPPDSQTDTSQPNEQLDANPPDSQIDTNHPNGQTVTYCDDIQPLLVRYCTACHSEALSLGGIRLDSYAAAETNASASKQEIQTGKMPMGTTMLDPDKALFNDWVNQGALECGSSM